MLTRLMLAVTLAAGLSLAGCAAAEKVGDFLFLPRNGKSLAEKGGEGLRDSGLLGKWGEIALLALTGLQNLYLGGKQVRTTVRRRRERQLA